MTNLKNNDFADLHVHTDRSDGIFSPEEVVEQALKEGLGAIAITDHDSVDAIGPCIDFARNKDIEVIPAVELSASNGDKEIHILGYFIDWKDPDFLDLLSGMQRSRRKRMERMLVLLSKKGIDVPRDRIFGPEIRGSVGRLHLARIMEEEHLVRNIYEAFDRLIGDGKECYIRHERLDYKKAISLIKKAGGVPVLAHPGSSGEGEDIPLYVEAGLRGLEVFHTKHKFPENDRYLKLSKEYNLLTTGGSDCHGEKRKGSILLGKVRVSREIVEALRKEAGKQNIDNRP